jgi:hypothetical protein
MPGRHAAGLGGGGMRRRRFGLAMILALVGWGCPALADSIDINGVTRSYTVQLAATKPAPLVIVLHGNTRTGADMISRTSWPAVAKREGFGVVFPDGLNRAWADLRPDTNRAGRVAPKAPTTSASSSHWLQNSSATDRPTQNASTSPGFRTAAR